MPLSSGNVNTILLLLQVDFRIGGLLSAEAVGPPTVVQTQSKHHLVGRESCLAGGGNHWSPLPPLWCKKRVAHQARHPLFGFTA